MDITNFPSQLPRTMENHETNKLRDSLKQHDDPLQKIVADYAIVGTMLRFERVFPLEFVSVIDSYAIAKRAYELGRAARTQGEE